MSAHDPQRSSGTRDERSKEMFYWIYDVPALWVIVLFEAAFVGVCWLGTPSARSWLGQEPARTTC
jgi:hypothetical protein